MCMYEKTEGEHDFGKSPKLQTDVLARSALADARSTRQNGFKPSEVFMHLGHSTVYLVESSRS